MKSVLVFAGLLSVGVLLTGCDKAPPSTNQQSVATEAPEKQVEDLSMFDVRTAVPIDAEWYQKAATQGNADAQFNLGVMYANGEGVSKDAAKAVEWYQKAATQGDADAQLNLGAMYLRGEGVPKEVAKAVEWYQKAATQGNADAQHKLGWMYFYGEGVPTDAAKAVECWQKAAAQGNVRAQNMLALSYEIGQGVPKDAAKAVEWYQKAAAQGNVGAQYNLGRLYANDKGVPEDKVLAYAWSNLAGSRGQRIAVLDRADVERRMSAAEIAEAQRLSSSWKQGQILAREGQSASASGVPSATPGSLSKKRTGTLFLVSAAGQAITNHHVVAGCGELRVEGRDGLAKVVTEDVINDLALVQVPGEVKASAAITAEPGKLRQGEDIVVFGFPLNAVLSSGGNLTPGVVSALTGLGNNTNQIQITAPIQPGSSGSPVLNKKGEVVAVVSMKLSDSAMAKATGQLGQNVNFAVNGQTLKSFLDTHKVTFRSGAGFFSWDKSTADLADEARDWTLLVQCWK
ncbi:MAG TPA: tetratricopeptide repeat-containing serine protease family protein [Casimicrobiaceae bacterium]|nr:tetratricopeptide repeat-containing serine protease family protein [Casimicrobiaceae bacterium]